MPPARVERPSSAVGEDDIQHFALEGLLPQGQLLAVHLPLRTLTRLALEAGTPYPLMVAQEQCTASELSLVLPLLAHYPSFVPLEVLLASFDRGPHRLGERLLAQARARLQEARASGTWDAELRLLRNMLWRARGKLRRLGLDATSILEVGYLLLKNPREPW